MEQDHGNIRRRKSGRDSWRWFVLAIRFALREHSWIEPYGWYYIVDAFEHQTFQLWIGNHSDRKATWKKNLTDLWWLSWSLSVAPNQEIGSPSFTFCSLQVCNTTIPLHLKYLWAFTVVCLILIQQSSKASHVCLDRINGIDLKFNTLACFILSLIEKPYIQCKITATFCFTHSLLLLQGSTKYM